MKETLQNIPNHIGIIMDGNGRWATARGKKRTDGHRAGAVNLKKLIPYMYKKGVKVLSIYAFSTENFKRDEEEVMTLMNLFMEYFTREYQSLKKEKVRILFSGRREPLRKEILNAMDKMMDETKNYENATLNICINYGGHTELLDMTKKIGQKLLDGELTMDELSCELLSKHLYQELPPIDFVIRTSGEHRISNFMLWQASYAEYYFPEVLFPDFNESEFDKAIEVYSNRDRRFGGVKS